VKSLQVGVWVSVGVHAALIGYLGSRPLTAAAPPPPAITVELVAAPPPPEPAPLDVALLDPTAARPTELAPPTPPPPRPAPPAPSPPHGQPGAPRVAATEGHAPIDPYATPDGPPPTGLTPPPEGHRPSALDMRRPRVALELPATVVEREQRRDAPPPAPDPTTGQLAPNGHGTFVTHEGPFDAHVRRDGTVHFEDSANAHVSVNVPSRKAVGDAIGDWYAKGDKSDLDREKVGINNNRAHDEDTRPDHGKVAPTIISGGFDATDAMMRRHGQDPYASRKLKYLDSTRDERAAIGARNRKLDLQQSAILMQRDLARLAAALPDPTARREALFELWDDCAEAGDPDLVAGGAAARALVVGYIRAHHAAGTADGYTAAELATLNRRRRSTAAFAPY
jgi:hypothetical protein